MLRIATFCFSVVLYLGWFSSAFGQCQMSIFEVTPHGQSIPPGGTATVSLDAHAQAGTDYVLYRNGLPTDNSGSSYQMLSGSSNPTIQWSVTDPGTYTVKALQGGCEQEMLGRAQVTVNNSCDCGGPALEDPELCLSISSPQQIRISGGLAWGEYQLKKDGVDEGDPVYYYFDDCRDLITWDVSQPGRYTVEGPSGCGVQGFTDVEADCTPPVCTERSTIVGAPTEPFTVCEGNLTLSSSDGRAGTWYRIPLGGSDADRQTIPGSAQQIIVSQSGTYILRTTSCGVPFEDATRELEFQPQITNFSLTGLATRCQGLSTTEYTASGRDVNTFTWDLSGVGETEYTITYTTTIGGTGQASTSTAVVTWEPGYIGTAQIQATAYGCGGTEAVRSVTTQTITQTPPTITAPVTEIGFGTNSVLLTASEETGVTYQWYRDGVALPGETQQTHYAARPGSYTVETSSETCPSSISDPTTVTIVNNHNYVIARTIRVPAKANGTAVTEADLTTLSNQQKNEAITYLDGLGRADHQVGWQVSPGQQDLTAPMTYDEQGRADRQYLPYVGGNNGYYKAGAPAAAEDYYQDATRTSQGIVTDNMPYASVQYEASPLNRTQQQGAPGAVFQPGTDHTVRYQYPVNDATTYAARQWTLNASAFPSSTKLYDAGELTLTEVTDEDGKVAEVYTDKLGQVVLRRTRNGAELLDTYYIYDEHNNLRVVLPPEASTNLTPDEAFLNRWAYRYAYDDRQRLSGQKAPGADWHYMLYDKRDRLVMSQDGRQREEGEWLFTHYDALDRPILSGICYNTNTYAQMQTALDTYLATDPENNATPVGEDEVGFHRHGDPTLELNRYEGERKITATQSITLLQGFEVDFQSAGTVEIKAPDAGPTPPDNGAFPALADCQVLQLYHYDSYDFDQNGTVDFAYDAAGIATGATIDLYQEVYGKPTGATMKVLETNQWLSSALFYDDKGRVIQTQSENHIGGQDRITTEYSFHGLMLRQWHQQTSDEAHGSQDLTVLTRHQYDHSDRLTHVHQTVGIAAEQLLARYEYNELGQLIDKGLHQEDPDVYCQSVDYRYTIRGWLASINQDDLSEQAITGTTIGTASADLFGQEFAYNTSVSGLTSPSLFNGNISAVTWNSSTLSQIQAYRYTYDAVNRLEAAGTLLNSAGSWVGSSNYVVSGITYDKNGNLGALTRRGADGSVMDNLTYNYQGNQLTSVSDAGSATVGFVDGSTVATEYQYDGSGNLTEDLNKDVDEVIYNHLNLPREVRFLDGNTITYTYDATGTKLKQTVTSGGTVSSETDYVTGRQYQGKSLDFLVHAEGRTKFGNDSFTQHYDLGDHLGNTRVTFQSSETITTFAASMETGGDLAAREGAYFEGVDDSRQTLAYHNASPPSSEEPTPNKVATLNAAKGRVKGPAKSLRVHAGDSIHIEVQVSYEEHSRKKVRGANGILAAVASLFNPGTAGIEAAGASQSLTEALAGTTLLDRDKTGVPKAYLNYVVLNKDSVVIDQGYVPVSEAAKIQTRRRGKGKRKTDAVVDSAIHERLAIDLDIQEEGYLYTYVSNESNWDVDVHFDEMAVAAASSAPLIVQSQDYYPHGLVHQQPLTNPSTDYLYNGMERVGELDLNVYSAAFRTYDPALGRWWQQDPMQDAMPGLSAYHQTYGNPVSYRDPLGLYGYGGGLNRHIGESAGEQWMREHGMGAGYTNPVFQNTRPSYGQQQMNQFFSSLPAGKYQVGGDDREMFRLTGFIGDSYYAHIFYRSFFGGGKTDPGIGFAELVSPESFKLKRIGEAYYSNVKYEETMLYLGFKNASRFKLSYVELNFSVIGIRLRARNFDGRWKSKSRAQREAALAFNIARELVYRDLVSGEFDHGDGSFDAEDAFIKYLDGSFIRADTYPIRNAPGSKIDLTGIIPFPLK